MAHYTYIYDERILIIPFFMYDLFQLNLQLIMNSEYPLRPLLNINKEIANQITTYDNSESGNQLNLLLCICTPTDNSDLNKHIKIMWHSRNNICLKFHTNNRSGVDSLLIWQTSAFPIFLKPKEMSL
jgi:hypothetical protein